MNDVEGEVSQAGALVPAMADVEIEAQAKLAKLHPRSMKKAMDDALAELELAPELAARAFYAIPYKEYKDGQERTVMVEGPSIKAAMSLAGHWGNCANGIRVVAQDEERITVEGVFIDYERNVRTVRQQVVSRLRYDRKTAKMIPLREDRVVMAIAAGGSKAVRNAIIPSIPAVIVEKYMAKAKSLSIGMKKPGAKMKAKDLTERLDKMVAEFAKLGVTGTQLAAYMKTNLAAIETNEDKLTHMVGIYNAIKDGVAPASEYFGAETPEGGQAERASGATGSVKMEDLLKKKTEEPEQNVVWPGDEEGK